MTKYRFTTSLLCFALFACQPAEQEMRAELLPVQLPCDVAAKGCIAGMDELHVIIQFDENFGALKPFQLRLQMDPKTTIQIDEINLVFSMAGMNMGLNKYSLIRESDELWIANVTLPICTSGRSDWLADFEITASNQLWKVQVPFVLGPAK